MSEAKSYRSFEEYKKEVISLAAKRCSSLYHIGDSSRRSIKQSWKDKLPTRLAAKKAADCILESLRSL